jgi:hypothetical protein
MLTASLNGEPRIEDSMYLKVIADDAVIMGGGESNDELFLPLRFLLATKIIEAFI